MEGGNGSNEDIQEDIESQIEVEHHDDSIYRYLKALSSEDFVKEKQDGAPMGEIIRFPSSTTGDISMENTSTSPERSLVTKKEREFFGGYGGATSGFPKQGFDSGSSSYVGSVGYNSMKNIQSPNSRSFSGMEKQDFEYGGTSYAGSTKGIVEEKKDYAHFVPEKGFYQPSTDQTWEAYQALISLVEAHSNVSLPRAVLCGVADEVLSVLKSDVLTDPWNKKIEIEKILNTVPDFIFNQLVTIGNLITDYYLLGQTRIADNQAVLFVPEKDFYQPKSEDTSTTYKLILDLVNDQLTWQPPQIVLCVLVHEVLVILKDSSLQDSQKKTVIESSLNTISNEKFDLLSFFADLITDFSDSLGNRGFTEPEVSRELVGNEYLIPRSLLRDGFQYESETVNLKAEVSTEAARNEDRQQPKIWYKHNSKFIHENSSEEKPGTPDSDFDASPADEVEGAVHLTVCVNSSLTEIAVNYSSEDESVNPPLTGNKRISSSFGEEVTQAAEESGSPKRFCSNDEAVIVSPKADEEGWVKVDVDEDGMMVTECLD